MPMSERTNTPFDFLAADASCPPTGFHLRQESDRESDQEIDNVRSTPKRARSDAAKTWRAA